MQDRINERQQQIDHATNASICNAIGERLRRNLIPRSSVLPDRLQKLLNEMQSQDRENMARISGV